MAQPGMLDWLAQRARLSPHRPALIFDDRAWSYGELNRLVARLCSRLAAAGVEAGQHVAILLPNRVETVGLIHALARLGAVLVPLNTRLTAPELAWQLRHSDSRLLICDRDTEAIAASLPDLGLDLFSVDPPQTPGLDALERLPDLDAARWLGRPLDLAARQGLIFTSGTTGQPKGALLTWANHFWSATASAFRLGTDPNDRWLACMPLYHVGGLAIVWRCCLYGTPVVLQAGFDPAAVSQALERHAVSLISLVPTMLQRLLETHAGALAASRLRCLLLGGAAAPPALIEQSLALKLPVAPTYGLTEAASQVVTATPAEAGRKPGSVGRPLMFSTVEIVGAEGQPLPAGEIGEIVVSGPTVMEGYYRQPAATAHVLKAGRLATGDLGYLDEAGDLWLVQRRADLIVSGGENVYPAEVEAVLSRHPAVAEVCVVGLADEQWGQRVAAAVVLHRTAPRPTEAELLEFSRRTLAGYKQPRLIRFVEALPRTASGKIQREAVRRSLAASAQ